MKRTRKEQAARIPERLKKDRMFEHEVRKYFKKKGMPDPFKTIRGFKKGGKVDDTMEKILKGMSAKERKAFLESMGFATKDKEGVSRSYRKAGGKMKSKGYAGGGKVKQEKALELKKKAGPKTKKKQTKKPDLFEKLLYGSRGAVPGETFKAGGKVKSKGYKAGGKMKNNSQSGHNRLY